MSTYQNAAGNPPPDWLAKLEEYACRAADAIIDTVGSVAKDVDDLVRSITQRLRRGRE